MPNEEGKGETETPEIEAGVSVDITDDVKEQLTPELQAAIAAGAPVVIFVRDRPGGLKVQETRTFEKGYAAARKVKIDGKSFEVVQKDLLDLIEVHKFIEESIKNIKKACDVQIIKFKKDRDKAHEEAARLRKDLKKRKDKLREIKKDLKEFHDKYKD